MKVQTYRVQLALFIFFAIAMLVTGVRHLGTPRPAPWLVYVDPAFILSLGCLLRVWWLIARYRIILPK